VGSVEGLMHLERVSASVGKPWGLRLSEWLIRLGLWLRSRYEPVTVAPGKTAEYLRLERWRLAMGVFLYEGERYGYSHKMVTVGICTRPSYNIMRSILVGGGRWLVVPQSGIHWLEGWDTRACIRARSALPYPTGEAPLVHGIGGTVTQRAKHSTASTENTVFAQDR
jgi:hypothetical protein